MKETVHFINSEGEVTHTNEYLNVINMPVRTCSEICIDANNNANDLAYIIKLSEEIKINAKRYPLVQLQYMNEHLLNIVCAMARKDAKNFRDLLD